MRDAEHYRTEAERARVLAATAARPEDRELLLNIADGWERLAAQVEFWAERERE